jgi:Hypoxia induced protein conserved region
VADLGWFTLPQDTLSRTGTTEFKQMKTFLVVLMVLAMLGVLGVMVTGMVGMVRGGNPARSNALMRWRVILQAGALIIFVMLMTLMKS